MANKKNDGKQKKYDHKSIDELLSSRLRLAIMAVLLGCEKCDFVYLREKTGATDGNLTAHCKKLEDSTAHHKPYTYIIVSIINSGKARYSLKPTAKPKITG